MTATDSRQSLAIAEPDMGIQAGFGLYFGVVAAGFVAVGGTVTGLTTGTLLGAIPTTITAVTIAGHLLTGRARGLPERIGGSRVAQLGCVLTTLLLSTGLLAPSIDAGRVVTTTLIAVAVTGLVSVGVIVQCRNRYVQARTPEDPRAVLSVRENPRWSTLVLCVTLVVLVVAALGNVAVGNWPLAVLLGGQALLWLAVWGSDEDTLAAVDPAGPWQSRTLRLHEAGLVLEGTVLKRLIPWKQIRDVHHTDEELRFGCRWFAVRGDARSLDDPDSVVKALKERQ